MKKLRYSPYFSICFLQFVSVFCSDVFPFFSDLFPLFFRLFSACFPLFFRFFPLFSVFFCFFPVLSDFCSDFLAPIEEEWAFCRRLTICSNVFFPLWKSVFPSHILRFPRLLLAPSMKVSISSTIRSWLDCNKSRATSAAPSVRLRGPLEEEDVLE